MNGKIIRIPSKENLKKDTTPSGRLVLEDLAFTCPNCKTNSKIKFDKIVFRSVDFYCGSCGSFFKLTNPAFGKKY